MTRITTTHAVADTNSRVASEAGAHQNMIPRKRRPSFAEKIMFEQKR